MMFGRNLCRLLPIRNVNEHILRGAQLQRRLEFCYSSRHLSSVPADVEKIKPKKVRKSKKTLSTSVINVTGNEIFDQKTNVTRLKPSQLGLLKTNDFPQIPSVNTSTIETSSQSLPIQEIDELDILGKKTLELVDKIDDNKPHVTKRQKFSDEKRELLQLLQMARDESMAVSHNQCLATFIDVCISVNLLDEAIRTLQLYMKSVSAKKRRHICLTILPFNTLLKGFSEEKNYSQMSSFINILKELDIKPDVDTFALFLSCLAHFPASDSNMKEIHIIVDWMTNENISLKSVWRTSTMAHKNQKLLLETIGRIDMNLKMELESCDHLRHSMKQILKYENKLTNSLNESLFSTEKVEPLGDLFTEQKMLKNIDDQFNMEQQFYVQFPSINNYEATEQNLHHRKQIAKWEERWRESVGKSFARQKKVLQESFEKNTREMLHLYPYLLALSDDEFICSMMIVINSLCLNSEGYSPSYTTIACNLGDEIYQRYASKYKIRNNLHELLRSVCADYCKQYVDPKAKGWSYNSRVNWEMLLAEKGLTAVFKYKPPEWPISVRITIGKVLLNIIISSATIPPENSTSISNMPVFYKVARDTFDKGFQVKTLPSVLESFRLAEQNIMIFPSYNLPMICPPIPWTSLHYGCYFLNRAELIRVPAAAKLQKERLKTADTNALFPVMDALNQLGSIPWVINHSILDFALQVFRTGGWPQLGIAVKPDESSAFKINDSMSLKEKIDIKRQKVIERRKKSESYSLWCDAVYKLSIANHFRDKLIWLPQNLDFRGRAYPIPPHMTHISADLFRSLMLFAKSKELGESGLRWLKIHLINLTGFRKTKCISDRLAFCEEMLDDIFDSADNPLDGRQWWTESDEPWQTLAACKELTKALRSDNPEKFMSNLPIHQDGSCNGLQHYAALGRDAHGAKSVNLMSMPIPQDVYTEVARKVETLRQKDAETGNMLAKALDGHISRKVIKQTVMTTVYGVTKFGAKAQIFKQLKLINDLTDEEKFRGATYVMTKTFQALEDMFSATKEIQTWLANCSDHICKIHQQNVEWVTPLDFPVTQPYSVLFSPVLIPGKIAPALACDTFLRPNPRKQKNALPPNFIHSLDSCHMMLTSLYCQEAGITFAAVHDCFWTHASSVDVMNKICREQFVSLHSEPILEDLSQFFIKKYSDSKIKHLPDLENSENIFSFIPKKGSFNIREVLDSVFFFS